MKFDNDHTEYKRISTKQIYIDPLYQRDLDNAKVQRIVKNFDPLKLNPLKVSFRDGRYYVFDGQHTRAALIRMNNGRDCLVPCRVYYGLTRVDEMNLFLAQTGESSPVAIAQKYRALFNFGDRDITDMVHACEYNELQKTDNLGAKSVRNIHVTLHRSLEIAKRLGYIDINPADMVILPRMEPQKVRTMDREELTDFLTEIKGHKYEPLLFTTVFTGLRLGEVLGLTWDCVDFDNNTITVEKQHGRDRATGEYVFTSIKNDQTRVLTAAQEVMNVLRDHKRKQRQMAKDAGNDWHNTKNLVFTNETGRYIDNKMLYMYFKRVMKKIGMSDMRFHDLRHTYAVNSLKAGDDIKTLQENLGHATAAFTLSTYAHATPNMKQECARRMDSFIHSITSEI